MSDDAIKTERLKGLIADNRDMLGRTYVAGFGYIPTESDMSDLPVKYGATEYDWKQTIGHHPVYSEVNVSDVRFMVKLDDVYYFAGNDGCVWSVMPRAWMGEEDILPDMSDLTTFAWYTAEPVACTDMHHRSEEDRTIPYEMVDYGWYVARVLSEKVWMSEGKDGNWCKSDTPGILN